jgi:LacI family transcriptional regulator, repressor for deo operon, udp, cdd, tsx, nupC, and nupG
MKKSMVRRRSLRVGNITIRDVAAAARVSVATVSRVLSNPTVVATPTRKAVLQVIRKLGFSPNAAAKSLRTFRSRKFLVTVPDIANPFFSRIIQGIEDAALTEGYSVLLGDTHHEPGREEHYAMMLMQREADGLIFLGHRLPDSLRAWFRSSTTLPPVVNGCEYSEALLVPSAHIDNAAAAAQAMDHLYALGHRRIAVVTGPMVSPLSRDRLAGTQRSARAHRAEKLLQVVNGDFSIDAGITAAARLLAQEQRPTAIFCFNDEMAIGVLDYARQRALRVPEALSVVGFDDIRFARHANPPLTTVWQPAQEIGRETVRLLIGVLNGTITKPVSVTLPHRLEIRASSAPPSEAGPA